MTLRLVHTLGVTGSALPHGVHTELSVADGRHESKEHGQASLPDAAPEAVANPETTPVPGAGVRAPGRHCPSPQGT